MPYGKCDDKFWKHPKVKALAERHRLGAVGLFWCSISYCNDSLNDGHLERSEVMLLGGYHWRSYASELVRVGLWEEDDRDFIVHDFLGNLHGTTIPFNKSREQVLADRERKSLAGSAGADARWHTTPNAPTPITVVGFGWGSEWSKFAEAWHERGYSKPPSEAQRKVLWEVVDNRPADAAKWLRSAPAGCTPFEAVQHVLRKWQTFRRSVA